MMQTLVFFFYIGITGLIFSKVEGYTYTDGIYYMVVTTLTIGFGDITPATPCMKVLTFPFTIIGITLLALIVTSIVRLLADRARRRKLDLKKRLKKKVSEKKKIHAGYGSKLTPWAKKISKGGDGPRLKRSLTLQEELERLREDDWKRERRSNLKSMALGFAVFLVFWFIGALIFDFVEVSRSQEMKANPSHGDTATRSISVICTFFLEEYELMTDSF
jgi:potassium channel subfamily K